MTAIAMQVFLWAFALATSALMLAGAAFVVLWIVHESIILIRNRRR